MKRILLIIVPLLLCLLVGCASVRINVIRSSEEKNADTVSVTDKPIEVIPTTEEDIEINKALEEPADELPNEEQGERPEEIKPEASSVDVIFFMGQSNMSGKGGDAKLAPDVLTNAGEEFRAYSNPTKLYPISEPFGKAEDNPNGLRELSEDGKSGSMVSSFVNEYYELTGHKVIAVSIAAGGVAMDLWNSAFYEDVAARIENTLDFVNNNDINVGKYYVVWMQGESDEGREVSREVYTDEFEKFFGRICEYGIDEVFVIMHCSGVYSNGYMGITDAQMKLCNDNPKYCLATTVLRGIGDDCYEDTIHVNQHTLNLVGIESAKAAAYYTNTGRKPVIYNYLTEEPYVPEESSDLTEEMIEKVELSNVNKEY